MENYAKVIEKYDLYVLNRDTNTYILIKSNLLFDEVFELQNRLDRAGCCTGLKMKREIMG